MTSSHKLVSHQFQVSSSSLPTLEESVGLQGQSAGDVAIVLHGGVDLARGWPHLQEVCLQVVMVTGGILVGLLQLWTVHKNIIFLPSSSTYIGGVCILKKV